MNDVAHPAVRESEPVELRGFRERIPLLSLLRKDVASNGPAWLPLVLVLGAIGAVAYADHLVLSISLVYLYIFPLGVGAIFLQRELSYSLIAVCILFHDFFSPRNIGPGLRIFHNLSAMLCFAFVVTSSSDISTSGGRWPQRFSSSVTTSFTTWSSPRKCNACFFPWVNRPLPDSKSPA